jgi:polar amino acid transport system substrate-binding protein
VSHLRIFAICSCLFLGCASAPVPPPAAAPTPSPALRLASSPWPPFTDSADNPHVALELVGTALARAGYRAVSELVPISALNEGLREGRYDGSEAVWRSAEREQYLLYSDPYLENRLHIVGQKGADTSAASFAQLAGKKIGIVEGFAYGPEVEGAKEPVFVRSASTEENFRALLRGEVDYVLSDALVIHHLVEQYPQQVQERLAVGKNALVKRTLHLALRKDVPAAAEVIAAFNRELARMLKDGSYHRVLEVDWIHADFDGDGQLELIAAGRQVGKEAPTRAYQVGNLAGASSTVPSDHTDPKQGAGFVIEGVYYDSWQAVPDEYKTRTEDLSAKPRTLRLKVFQF